MKTGSPATQGVAMKAYIRIDDARGVAVRTILP